MKTNETQVGETELLIAYIRALQRKFTDEGRILFWRELRLNYCQHCGSDKLPCHCENDE